MGPKRAATMSDAGTSKRDQLEFANALEKRLERLVENARARRRSRRSSQTSARSEPEPEPDAVLQAEDDADLEENEEEDDEGEHNTKQRQRLPEAEASASAHPLAVRERPAPVARITARERLLQSQMQSIAGAPRATDGGAGVAPDVCSERDSESVLSVYSVTSDLESYSVRGEPFGPGAQSSSSGGPLARKSSLRIDLLRVQRERERTRGALPAGGVNKGPLSAPHNSIYSYSIRVYEYSNMVPIRSTFLFTSSTHSY